MNLKKLMSFTLLTLFMVMTGVSCDKNDGPSGSGGASGNNAKIVGQWYWEEAPGEEACIFTFEANGDFSAEWYNHDRYVETDYGTYILKDDVIYMTYDYGETEEVTIIKYASDSMRVLWQDEVEIWTKYMATGTPEPDLSDVLIGSWKIGGAYEYTIITFNSTGRFTLLEHENGYPDDEADGMYTFDNDMITLYFSDGDKEILIVRELNFTSMTIIWDGDIVTLSRIESDSNVGSSNASLIGTWVIEDEYYEGNYFFSTLTFKSDGTFSITDYFNGEIDFTTGGRYSYTNNILKLNYYEGESAVLEIISIGSDSLVAYGDGGIIVLRRV